MNKYFKEAQEMYDTLVSYRHTLHQCPELGLHLPETVKFVTHVLDSLDIEYQVLDNSIITACIGSGEPCIMLRADMDALPMKEESGVDFASTNGHMHACGHDMHTTMLLGAAHLLKVHEDELKGTVKLLFQSGEETFTGANAAMDEGVLENPKVDAAFCMHVDAINDVGLLAYGDTPMAAVYGFKIIAKGKGAHGSTPDLGVDPINIATHIYLGLQELISREISASTQAALTIGHIEAGNVPNVIPEQAVLEGTLRTFDPEVQKYLIKRISEIAENTAKAYLGEATIEVLYDVPVVVNDKSLNTEFVSSIKEVEEKLQILPLFHSMGSEDFAFYTDKVPSCYMAICAGIGEERYSLHNPKVKLNDQALPLGAAIHTTVAMNYLKNHFN